MPPLVINNEKTDLLCEILGDAIKIAINNPNIKVSGEDLKTFMAPENAKYF